ncbi:MAG TPA: hypothetical protein PKY59_04320 [Pyrinomonadaceae bacterium]|nr:hypothetical protein [Pyrinomonadaceae bacterium]
MHKAVTFLFLCFLLSIPAFSQSLKKELDKAKQIKLLESTREDVRKILADFEHDDEENEDYIQGFSSKEADIEVLFSRGDCSDIYAYWDVPEWKVTRISISPKETVKAKEFDFSKFKEETNDEESDGFHIYQDEDAGIAFEIDNDEVQSIRFYPPKSKSGFLCANDNVSEILSNQKKFIDAMMNDEGCRWVNHPANVTALDLSAHKIIIGCDNKNNKCPNVGTKISVTTTAVDPENDTIVYNYEVSDGKIIGTGAKVVWDLSGVKAGTYTITAGVDDGCGICGQTKTETVTINECPDCSLKPNQ